MKKAARERGFLPVSRFMKKFELGDRVHIAVEPSAPKGMPHPRFHGRTGKIVGKMGRSYLVEITDGAARKLLISSPVHLMAQGEN